MKNEANDNDSMIEFDSDHYSELFNIMFSDLKDLSRGDKDLFLDLFYNRDDDFNEFKGAAKNLYETGANIVVIGDAGIGKSSFLYWLYYDNKELEKLRLFPVIIDFRDHQVGMGSSKNEELVFSFKQAFIDDAKKYLDFIGKTITLHDSQSDNLFLIQKILLGPDSLRGKKRHMVFIIDDFDYAEKDELFPLLKFLLPYARSPNVSIVLSVRPTLFYTIQRNDATFKHFFTDRVNKIRLHDLSIHHVLAMRLAPILATSNIPNKGFFRNIIDMLKQLKSPEMKYIKIIKRLGIMNLESLKTFHFPFTEGYCSFMRNITSNNIRECFNIAFESLTYILDHYKELDDDICEDTKEIRKIIPNRIIVDLFTSEGCKYTLFDLHLIKNHKNNSLYFNILEAVKYCRNSNLDNDFHLFLGKLGHKQKDIKEALVRLARKSNRFLSSNDFTYAQDYVKDPIKYELTKKGEYYLDFICNWPEYKEKFDNINPTSSIRELIEGNV